ncbi:hypothetical protein [Klebsiella variicola]|uniref:hypothetical protein n=1 Tax=Klebsiella variicola TaxID=244366 RepID=UPI0005B6189C|nr:hypothetical protein [Klebsiella variicola]QOV61565.1 hypothetical protein AMN10_25665 [Klebsiella variicola]CEP33469.1 hypothetical protein KV8917_900060 [Klebsiella variicola]
MTKYNELDSKILNKIVEYPAPFSSLYVKDVAEECIRIAKEENKPEPFGLSVYDLHNQKKIVSSFPRKLCLLSRTLVLSKSYF